MSKDNNIPGRSKNRGYRQQESQVCQHTGFKLTMILNICIGCAECFIVFPLRKLCIMLLHLVSSACEEHDQAYQFLVLAERKRKRGSFC